MNEEGMMIDDQVPKFPSRHKNITITITINQSLDENRGGDPCCSLVRIWGRLPCVVLHCVAFRLLYLIHTYSCTIRSYPIQSDHACSYIPIDPQEAMHTLRHATVL